MKILQLGKFYPIKGGVEKTMFDLTCGLSQRGIQCDMLCVSSDGDTSDLELNAFAHIYKAKLLKKMAATMLSMDIIIKLRSIASNYDIIHVHHPDPMVALALFLSGYKGKVVLHWHSDILKQKFLLKLYRPLQNWLINRADVIIGTTPKYLSESPHLKSCNKEKIAVPSGIKPIIPSKTVVKHIRDRYKGKRIVFSLGRLVGYKGFEYLIESAKYLPDEYIIVIGGTGPLKKHLEELIELNDLSSKVKLLGWISDEDLSGYYGACDLYVISSIWKTEAFGLVQIEAMSCGKPIVATKIPESGVDWVNKDGYSGINVETENPKALANAITTILNNEQEYEKFSVNAKKRFNELFTLDKMVNNCLSVYEKIMSC